MIKLMNCKGMFSEYCNNDLIDLAEAVWTNNLKEALDLAVTLCHDKYWQGYNDGFEVD